MPANAKNAASPASAEPLEITITRTFDAPRETVYRLFTEPEHVMKWGGPRSHIMKHFTQDVRVGGKWRGMLHPTGGGKDLWQGGTFRSIDPPKHVSYTFAWEDDNGQPQNETIVTIDFEDLGRKTRLTFNQSGFPSEGEREGHDGGWSEAFDKFREYLAATQSAAPG